MFRNTIKIMDKYVAKITLGPWAQDPREFCSSGLPRGQNHHPMQAPRSAGTAGKVYPSSSLGRSLEKRPNWQLFLPGPLHSFSPITHSLSLSLPPSLPYSSPPPPPPPLTLSCSRHTLQCTVRYCSVIKNRL